MDFATFTGDKVTDEEIRKRFQIGPTIGSGSFGNVFLNFYRFLWRLI